MSKIKHYAYKAKVHFAEKGKIALMTGGEVIVLSGSMILTKKFLDFKELFKDKIAADPTYADKWYIKHQGAIKAFVGVVAAAYIEQPWLRLIAIGVALEGAITEIREFSKDSAGKPMFDAIGAANNPVDQELMLLAQQYDNQLNGTSGVVDQYTTAVAGVNTVDAYTTAVAGVYELVEYQ